MYHQLYFLAPLSCFHAHLLALSHIYGVSSTDPTLFQFNSKEVALSNTLAKTQLPLTTRENTVTIWALITLKSNWHCYACMHKSIVGVLENCLLRKEIWLLYTWIFCALFIVWLHLCCLSLSYHSALHHNKFINGSKPPGSKLNNQFKFFLQLYLLTVCQEWQVTACHFTKNTKITASHNNQLNLGKTWVG